MAKFVETDKKSHDTMDKPSICTIKCHASVVKSIALKENMKVLNEDEPWDIFWSHRPVSLEQAQKIQSHQKVNHFLGMNVIARKDTLAKTLNCYSEKFPFDYDFHTKTWCLPEDSDKLRSYAEANHNVTYIIKPRAGCGGKGINLTKRITNVHCQDKKICQIYLSKPLLIEKYKFDIRLYALITSCDPLSIFVYNDGLLRFATVKYQVPSPTNITNQFIHLTNYSINKCSPTFDQHSTKGSKRNFEFFETWLRKHNYDVSKVWYDIDDVIVKTIISGLKEVQKSYKDVFINHNEHSACFQILGFDIILDRRLKPYLLEVNKSPSLHTATNVDREVKENLISDIFKILYFGKKSGESMIVFEDNNIGNFRRVYPNWNSIWYNPFLNYTLPNSSDTTSSPDQSVPVQTKDKSAKRKELKEKLASRRK